MVFNRDHGYIRQKKNTFLKREEDMKSIFKRIIIIKTDNALEKIRRIDEKRNHARARNRDK